MRSSIVMNEKHPLENFKVKWSKLKYQVGEVNQKPKEREVTIKITTR